MQVITTHVNADFDTLGAMVGAKLLYPEAVASFPGSLERGLSEAIKKLPLPFDFTPAQKIDTSLITLLVLVDTNNSSRLGVFAKAATSGKAEVHVYDHHPKQDSDIKAAKEVSIRAGSSSTIIALILKEKDIRPGKNEATAMMAGIYEDTGFLCFPSTQKDDYIAAAYLLECGANLGLVSTLLQKEMTPEEVSLLDEFLKNETKYAVGNLRISINAYSTGSFSGDLSAIAHKVMDIERPDALVLIAETSDRTHFILRSASPGFDAGSVARELGGGGHPQAASATIKDITFIQAKDMAAAAIRKISSVSVTAKDIMSSPPITVTRASTIKEASALMLKYNVNAMPVVKNAVPEGVITRQTADKALYHGLGAEHVSEFMTSDFETISAETSVEEIRERILGYGQRIITVIEDKKICGVITRTDLIKLLKEELKSRPDTEVRKKRNIAHLMQETLPGRVYALLTEIGIAAEEYGCRAYAVGGFVRDLLLKRPNLDVDIVIEGNGGGFATDFAVKRGLKVSTHPRFGTAVVTYPDGFKLDIATARLEYYEKPGALPTVETSSLKLDLYRRDFTINTLSVALNPDKFASIVDFFGAGNDLKDGIIRIMHNLSFIEDPIRAMRAVRFSERFGFKISDHTVRLIKNSVRLGVIRRSSGSRILDELRNCFSEDRSTSIMRRLSDLGLPKLIHPSLEWNEKTERTFDNAKKALSWYSLLYRNEPVEGWLTLFLAFTGPLKQDALNTLAERLSVPGRKRLETIRMRAFADRAASRLAAKTPVTNSLAYKTLDPLPLELTLYIMAKSGDENAKKAISTYITSLRGLKTILNGNDLKKMGVREGLALGEALSSLLKARIDGKVSSREDEVAFMEKSLRQKKKP